MYETHHTYKRMQLWQKVNFSSTLYGALKINDACEASLIVLEEWDSPAQTWEGALAALNLALDHAGDFCGADEVESMLATALEYLESENAQCKETSQPGVSDPLLQAIASFRKCSTRLTKIPEPDKDSGQWHAANDAYKRALRDLEEWASPAQTWEGVLAALHLALRQARIFCSALEVEAMIKAAIDFLESKKTAGATPPSVETEQDDDLRSFRNDIDEVSMQAIDAGHMMRVLFERLETNFLRPVRHHRDSDFCYCPEREADLLVFLSSNVDGRLIDLTAYLNQLNERFEKFFLRQRSLPAEQEASS